MMSLTFTTYSNHLIRGSHKYFSVFSYLHEYVWTAPNPPTRGVIVLSWIPPVSGVTPTGYMIYYNTSLGGIDVGRVLVNVTNASEYVISGRSSDVYAIRIVALSSHLPSEVAEVKAIASECVYNYHRY